MRAPDPAGEDGLGMDVAGTQLVEKDIENLARGEAGGRPPTGWAGGESGRSAELRAPTAPFAPSRRAGAGQEGPPGVSSRLEVFRFSARVINSCD